MSVADTNSIIRAYLATSTTLTTLVGTRIYCPRLPENATLPAVSFFTRGSTSTPYIPGYLDPSIQFDCWAKDTEVAGVVIRGFAIARKVYRALYDSLQGIQNVSVASPAHVIGTDSNDYNCILAHTSNGRNKPITGPLTATYWVATGGTGMGSTWVSGQTYRPTYDILSAIEEVQGQDLVDESIPNYFRTLTFFRVTIRAE